MRAVLAPGRPRSFVDIHRDVAGLQAVGFADAVFTHPPARGTLQWGEGPGPSRSPVTGASLP